MDDIFTPEQIAQILEEFFKVVGTRRYVGERYVPIFGRKGEESIQWDNSAPYEPLTIVLYQGNSYTSRQFVPIGVDITNQEFWALTGNYNAQIELYHSETIAAREIADNALTAANNAQNDINTLLPKVDFSAENTVKDVTDGLDERTTALENRVLVVLGDSWSDGSNDPDTTWYMRVADRLGLTAYVTAAVAGKGFHYGITDTIPLQVASAVALVQNAGYTVNDVKYVIAFGGVNDYRHSVSYTNAASGMKTTYNNARTAFPNAKVFIVGPNAGKWDVMDSLDSSDADKKSDYSGFVPWMRDIKNNLHNNGYPIVWDASAWLNYYGVDASNLYNSDLLHPTQMGHNIIASYMLTIIQGTYTGPHFYASSKSLAASSNDSTPLSVKVTVDGGQASIQFECTGSALVTTNNVYWTLQNFPLFPGGTTGHSYRPGFVCSNFNNASLSDGYAPIRGYFNPNNRRLTLYPNLAGGLNQVFGSLSFAIY